MSKKELVEYIEDVVEYFDEYDTSIWQAEPSERHPMAIRGEKLLEKEKEE